MYDFCFCFSDGGFSDNRLLFPVLSLPTSSYSHAFFPLLFFPSSLPFFFSCLFSSYLFYFIYLFFLGPPPSFFLSLSCLSVYVSAVPLSVSLCYFHRDPSWRFGHNPHFSTRLEVSGLPNTRRCEIFVLHSFLLICFPFFLFILFLFSRL